MEKIKIFCMKIFKLIDVSCEFSVKSKILNIQFPNLQHLGAGKLEWDLSPNMHSVI